MSGCRDCKQCTRSALGKLLWAVLRFFWRVIPIFWLIAIFLKKCPECNHYMRWHQKIDGRFID